MLNEGLVLIQVIAFAKSIACVHANCGTLEGVDYNHPNLGGGFGPGKKFVGGHDFVGDDFNGQSKALLGG